MSLEPGTVFGKDFRIVRPLREGGMGAVYIAEQISTGKQRALKVMAAELAVDAATRERFVLEARAGSKIESDHVRFQVADFFHCGAPVRRLSANLPARFSLQEGTQALAHHFVVISDENSKNSHSPPPGATQFAWTELNPLHLASSLPNYDVVLHPTP